jgi:hypothetical protein
VPSVAGPAQIEVGRAQRQALEAFEAGRCLVFVGELQMESLDQEIELKAATPVHFLRVLPLQAGRTAGSR